MYECVMGLRKHEGQGCILADEMCSISFHMNPANIEGICNSTGDWGKPSRFVLSMGPIFAIDYFSDDHPHLDTAKHVDAPNL